MTLHLYFARFFNHFLCDAGYLKDREPFINLLVQGMVMGQSYRVKGTGEYLRSDQVDFSSKSAFELDVEILLCSFKGYLMQFLV